jgi:CRISPR-associated Csx2 family protein
MARKVFISFLGTNDYLPSNYFFGDNKITDIRFIQEAIIRIFCKDWSASDKAFIFLTQDAELQNWEDIELIKPNKAPKKNIGLKNRLEILKNDGFLLDVKPIMNIPEGFLEADIWLLFDKIFEQIEVDDNVIFDITHSFRSIPMLCLVLLDYARFIKKINIQAIYYGAFEVLGPAYKVEHIPIENRNAPIVDLLMFSKLQSWVTAANEFINLGKTRSLTKLISPLNNKIGETTKKAVDIIEAVRAIDIIDGSTFTNLQKNISELLDNKDIYQQKPFIEILTRVKNKIEAFKNDDINNGFIAVKWCIQHDLTQQGITLLFENIQTYILNQLKYDWKNKDYRDVVSSLLSVSKEKYIKKSLPGEDKLMQVVYSLSYYKPLSKIYISLSKGVRHDINHAGLREKPKTPDELKKSLIKYYGKTIELLGIELLGIELS